jgi:hypothetical protein
MQMHKYNSESLIHTSASASAFFFALYLRTRSVLVAGFLSAVDVDFDAFWRRFDAFPIDAKGYPASG